MGEEQSLLTEGLGRLQDLLGPGWKVEPVNRPKPSDTAPWMAALTAERLVTVHHERGAMGAGQILVEATRSLTPMRAREEFGPKVALMHSLIGQAAVLIIANWLSPRTRETLDSLGYGYLDLTGNVSLRLEQPTIVIRTEGAKQDPSPSRTRSRQHLRGARAGRLVRVLADVIPPYRATDLANASGVSPSYVSRLLGALEEEALITREGRFVIQVDWDALIHARAAQYALLEANSYVPMLAAQGIRHVLMNLREQFDDNNNIGPVAVTGSYSIREVLPAVAIGGQLMIYVRPDPSHNGALERIASRLGLRRSDEGADVLLLRARSSVVFEGLRRIAGLPYVALSQLALDSLSGTGRMPAEGEALIDYMSAHEGEWRLPSLHHLKWNANISNS